MVGCGWVFSWVMGYDGGWVASCYGFCGWLCHGSSWVVLILNLVFVPSCAVGRGRQTESWGKESEEVDWRN